jgi:D-sedoheptulose 7-phosphate isomerase
MVIQNFFSEARKIIEELEADSFMQSQILNAVEIIIHSLKSDGKILFCGNGGSAADAQHLAAELSGKFYLHRKALHAEALHLNTSYLTAVSNDYAFEVVYERLIEGIGKPQDILIALTTSGNSLNIIKAIQKASEKGMKTIVLTGKSGGKAGDFGNLVIRVPSENVPRIQEVHMLIGHIICQWVEAEFFKNDD